MSDATVTPTRATWRSCDGRDIVQVFQEQPDEIQSPRCARRVVSFVLKGLKDGD